MQIMHRPLPTDPLDILPDSLNINSVRRGIQQTPARAEKQWPSSPDDHGADED